MFFWFWVDSLSEIGRAPGLANEGEGNMRCWKGFGWITRGLRKRIGVHVGRFRRMFCWQGKSVISKLCCF